MTKRTDVFRVVLEVGQSKVFALALDWPGWARSGRGEEAALQALDDYGLRYARVLENTALGFRPPSESSILDVVERVAGTATTDFGAPDATLPSDTGPVDAAELARWQVLLEACWQAFDAAVQAAAGKTLRKGPRGGGRDLDRMVAHVQEVNLAYLSALGGKLRLAKDTPPEQALPQIRAALQDTLAAAVRGEIPAQGPRGGLRWTPRYFVRRLAWHELDHAWEIEDRIEA
jgi:hypothetical protein